MKLRQRGLLRSKVQGQPTQGIDKLELFLKIHKSCFGQMDEKEIQTVKNIIIYLNDNNKIKPRSWLSKLWRF
jgi:hypothetical protein